MHSCVPTCPLHDLQLTDTSGHRYCYDYMRVGPQSSSGDSGSGSSLPLECRLIHRSEPCRNAVGTMPRPTSRKKRALTRQIGRARPSRRRKGCCTSEWTIPSLSSCARSRNSVTLRTGGGRSSGTSLSLARRSRVRAIRTQTLMSRCAPTRSLVADDVDQHIPCFRPCAQNGNLWRCSLPARTRTLP